MFCPFETVLARQENFDQKMFYQIFIYLIFFKFKKWLWPLYIPTLKGWKLAFDILEKVSAFVPFFSSSNKKWCNIKCSRLWPLKIPYYVTYPHFEGLDKCKKITKNNFSSIMLNKISILLSYNKLFLNFKIN